jgi:hypothetical protein
MLNVECFSFPNNTPGRRPALQSNRFLCAAIGSIAEFKLKPGAELFGNRWHWRD